MDDDIDIGMTRENYNRFLEIAISNLSEDYFLQIPKTDKNTPFAYAKVRKNGTEFVEWCNRNIDMHKGIYIDIFPYDNIPDNEKQRKRQFVYINIINTIYVWSKTPDITEIPNNIISKFKQILRRTAYYMLKLVPSNLLLKLLDKKINLYNKVTTTTKACLFFPQYMIEYMEVKTLYPLKECKFEELIVPIPQNIDKYLTSHYGNYMELPPEEKRIGHRPYKIKL